MRGPACGIAVLFFLHGAKLAPSPALGTGGCTWLSCCARSRSPTSRATVVAQLLVPFAVGQLCRQWIGGWLDRHRRLE